MWDLGVFALIGLLAGAASELRHPMREPKRLTFSMLLGFVGSLTGGMISWGIWPAVNDGPLFPGALLTALFGAVVALIAWPTAIYARQVHLARRGVH